MKICSIDGCVKKVIARGWCHRHYKRWQMHGDPSAALLRRAAAPVMPGELPTRRIWHGMLNRCYNRTNKNFSRYGGRGITVCDRWQTFANFLADMGERPTGLTIDRIDNDGNYEPGNCRWATRKTQRRNAGNVFQITIGDKTVTLKEACEMLGKKYVNVKQRIRRGHAVNEALGI